jgi:large subunit ribosomal protein L15
MRVDELAPAPGSNKAKKRVGRGIGGKGGKTAGAGTKGQHSRGRGKVGRGFEGGQTGLKQRVPKLKGFNNPFRIEYSPVNLDQLASLEAATVGPDELVAAGLVRKGSLVKVLGRGEISSAVALSVHAVSKSAKTAIEAAGGSVTIVPLPYPSGRPPVQGNQFTNR